MVYVGGSTRGMSGDNAEKLIRVANLNKIADDRKMGAAELEVALGFGRYTYWRDMLKGEKSFGEKVARRIEEALDLPRGWMDQDHGRAAGAEAELLAKRLSLYAIELALAFDALEIPPERKYSAFVEVKGRIDALAAKASIPARKNESGRDAQPKPSRAARPRKRPVKSPALS